MNEIKNSFILKNPMIMYDNKKQQLDIIIEKLNKNLIDIVKLNTHRLDLIKNNHIIKNPTLLIKEKKNQFTNLIQKLELLNPLSIMKRGYSLTYIDDALIRDINNVKKNSNITVKLHNGEIIASVIDVNEAVK